MKKFLTILPVLVAVALAILNLTYDDRIKPDEVYEMCNQHIEWNTKRP